MIKSLIVGALLALQSPLITLNHPPTASVSSSSSACQSPPTFSERYVAYSSNNSCGAGAACVSGGGIRTLSNTAGGPNATQATSANQPIYTSGTPGVAGGNPYVAFISAGKSYMTFATALPDASATSITYIMVLSYTSSAATEYLTSAGAAGGLVWEPAVTSLKTTAGIIGSGLFVTGATTRAANTPVIVGCTYNPGAATWSSFSIAGGALVADASGTTTAHTVTVNTAQLGENSGSYSNFNLYEFDVLYNISLTTTDYSYYQNCYGI